MNDMAALQTFRAAEAEPDALALARGRRRLLGARRRTPPNRC
jgi:hypothetical protein